MCYYTQGSEDSILTNPWILRFLGMSVCWYDMYLCQIDTSGLIHTALAEAKKKSALIKKLLIPLVELGALLLTQLQSCCQDIVELI